MRSLFKFKTLPAAYDDLAPDGSEIRLLPGLDSGGLCHCTLPVSKISKAVKHKTVSEIWYCLSGAGEIWQGRDGTSEVKQFGVSDAFTVLLGNSFQFRDTGNVPLVILITTIPKWPGDGEAEMATGFWE